MSCFQWAKGHQASLPKTPRYPPSLPHSPSSYYPILTFPSQVELKSPPKNEFTICCAGSLQGSCKSAPAYNKICTVAFRRGKSNIIFNGIKLFISLFQMKWKMRRADNRTWCFISSVFLSKYFLVFSYARHLACFLLSDYLSTNFNLKIWYFVVPKQFYKQISVSWVFNLGYLLFAFHPYPTIILIPWPDQKFSLSANFL